MKFKVIKSTASTNGGYVNTIEGSTVSTVFGVSKTTKHRFLIKTDEELAAGLEDELPLSEYNQVPFVSEVEDQSGNTIEIRSVWLHKKVA